MRVLLFKTIIIATALLAIACSESGPSSTGTETGTGNATVGDTSGNVYEGDFLTSMGQMRHLVLQLKFVDKVVSGYAQTVTNGGNMMSGTIMGNWQRLNDAGDMMGVFSIQGDTTGEDLEFTFTGNSSGISGTLSSITNSPEKNTSSNGSFSLTATGATVAK